MVIYKTTNLINGKIYIGQDSNNNDGYFGSGLLIKRSINKYGVENFKKEILEHCKTKDELNEKEIYWIKKLDSTNIEIGYNIMVGGNGGDTFTNNPNKEHFLEYCRNRKGEKNGMFGKNHTKESIKKISENKKGQRKGLPTWNKGISIKNYSDKYKDFFKGKSGSENNNAKKYIFISPNNEEFCIVGEYDKFCIDNDLDSPTSKLFINKGVITKPKKGKPKPKRSNLIGWEIKRM